MTLYLHGNAAEEHAVDLAQEIRKILPSRPLHPSERPLERWAQLPENSCTVVDSDPFNSEDGNSAVVNHYQIGPDTLRVSGELFVCLFGGYACAL